MLKQVYTIRDDGRVTWNQTRLMDSNYTVAANEVDTPVPTAIKIPVWKTGKWTEFVPSEPLSPSNERMGGIHYSDYLHEDKPNQFDPERIDPAGTLMGFYQTDVHDPGIIPKTAVTITKVMWQYILNNQGIYRFDADKLADKAEDIQDEYDALKAQHGLVEHQIGELDQRVSQLYGFISKLGESDESTAYIPPATGIEIDEDGNEIEGGEVILPPIAGPSQEDKDKAKEAIEKEVKELAVVVQELRGWIDRIQYPHVIDSDGVKLDEDGNPILDDQGQEIPLNPLKYLVKLPPVWVDPDTIPMSPMEMTEKIRGHDDSIDTIQEACMELFIQDEKHDESINVTQNTLLEALEEIQKLKDRVEALE